MAMIPAKCTNCGANIQVDESKEAGICEACGTAFITEKVINNYNTINNYHADVVNVYNSPSTSNFVIIAGVLIKYKGSDCQITIPHDVQTIGEEAFKNCEGLVSVVIPDSVEEIKDRAFWQCENLLSVVFENAQTKVGAGAFSCCLKLRHVVLPSAIEQIPSDMFALCYELEEITIPVGCKEIHNGAFSCCSKLKKIELPESLLVIHHWAFACCSSLKSITIPASVRTIYARDERLEKHTISASNGSCFHSCLSLHEVTLKGNNTEIRGKTLFENCPSDIVVHASESWKSQNSSKLTNKVSNGCYIATCVYGSYDCPQVWTLRRYRDDTLGASWYGRLFIRIYYAVSPALVKWFGKTFWFKKLWQGRLDKMVAKLNGNGVENTPYQDKEW